MTQPINTEPTPKPLFTLGVYTARFASWANIFTKGYAWREFGSAPGASQIQWRQDQAAEDTVGELVKSPERIYELSKVMLAKGRTTKFFAESHYQSDPQIGHRYVAFTPVYKFASVFRSWLADMNNNNVFRLMFNGFPPYGREIPQAANRPVLMSEDSITGGDPLDDMVSTYAMSQGQQIEEYRQQQWLSNARIDGPAYLGRSGAIHLSDSGTISNTNDKIVVRYVVASTNRWWHVFDGRVLWVHVTDLENNEMMYYGVGGGSNRQSFFNGVNGVTSAFVFGGMMSMMHYMLKATGSPSKLEQVPGQQVRTEALRLMGEEDAVQLRAQYAALALDTFGTSAAIWRLLTNRGVTGSPPVPAIEDLDK